MSETRYAVIGAGHGGKAMAGHLAIKGYEVNLFNRTPGHVSAIREIKGIEVEGHNDSLTGFGNLSLVTSDIGEAVRDVDVIMVVVPSSAHASVARTLAPVLQHNQIIILNPGRTCGAIEFAGILRAGDCNADITLAEAGTFIYASRSVGPAEVKIFGMKNAVALAALPATRTKEVLEATTDAYPQYVDGGNVLKTGLDNMGTIFHPALAVLNAGRIEDTKGDFQFYIEGVTPTVARVLETLDRERVTVAASLGIDAASATTWLREAYGTHSESLYDAVHENESYYGIPGPATLKHRYIFEDVPMSVVPTASLGERYGVRTRGMQSIVRMASIMHGTDYWRRGRTLSKLGIDRLSVGELTAYVNEGIRPDPELVFSRSAPEELSI